MRNNIASLDKSTAKVVIFLASSEMTKSKVRREGCGSSWRHAWLGPFSPGRVGNGLQGVGNGLQGVGMVYVPLLGESWDARADRFVPRAVHTTARYKLGAEKPLMAGGGWSRKEAAPQGAAGWCGERSRLSPEPLLGLPAALGVGTKHGSSEAEAPFRGRCGA